MGQLDADTQFRIAAAALRDGRVSEAEGIFQKLLKQDPRHIEAHFALGIILGRTDRWHDALEHLSAVVDACPTRDQALYWTALAKKKLGQPDEAAEYCERALQIDPFNPIVLNELGLCRLTLNQADLAEKAFSRAVQRAPTTGVYQFNLGLALARLDRIYKARDAFQEAIRLEPGRVESHLELARILEILGLRQEVVSVLSRALETTPAESQLLTAYAAARAFIGQRAEAEAIFRRAVAAEPVAGSAYGLWLQQEGRFEESVDCFLTSIRAMPVQGVAYYGLSEAKVFEVDGESWLDRAETWIESPEIDLKGKTYLCFGLAKAYDRRGDAETAIRFFDLANRAAYSQYNEGRPFNRSELVDLTDKTIERYSAESFRQSVPGHSDSECPIFIVGMIRSGTTLLDQVVSSHPLVVSSGEPVFWMREADRLRRQRDPVSSAQFKEIGENYLKATESVAGSAPRITDKMPLNYAHLGLIHQVFPRARIIHLRRSPLDTCFSIYTTFLGQGPNFAYNQSNTVFKYREYLRLMAHWRKVLPKDSFIEIDYESLVSNREAPARRIIDFCGLDWDDACLHHERNEASIRTPSKWQARQPIYSSSLQRWKPYEPWLGELLQLKNVEHEAPQN